MISLILSLVVLLVGYAVYSRVTEKVFSPDDRATPAIAINDGVDCVPMKPWRAFLIQLLNIAGTGPIFGALMGACFGPVVFLWIVFGSILGGAVHDYMSGMISSRHGGASIAELSGVYLGTAAKWVMRIFSVILLILCGTVFVTSPAALISQLLHQLSPESGSFFLSGTFWIVVILIVMALGVLGGTIFGGYTIPEITQGVNHPQGLPVWPFMFVTVACGAISGFHATQSPMIAKCITSERQGRKIFYGAMITESVIALIWAAAGVAFYGGAYLLNEALSSAGPSSVVLEISRTMLKSIGGVLAVIGVVVCPITSGDTAFRSARLILAEITHLEQKKIRNRLIITLPLLAVGALLTQLDFNVLWRYFSWSNQTLAMISLWVATAYLLKNGKKQSMSLLTALPATFMSAVSMTYILMAGEGFGLSSVIAYPAGAAFAAILFAVYIVAVAKKRK